MNKHLRGFEKTSPVGNLNLRQDDVNPSTPDLMDAETTS